MRRPGRVLLHPSSAVHSFGKAFGEVYQRPVGKSTGFFVFAFRFVSFEWGSDGIRRKEDIVLADIGNADDENAHPPLGAMDHSRRNMNDRTFENRVLDAVEEYAAFPIQDVVKFRADLVVMRTGAIDVDRVRPSRDASIAVLPADQKMPPAATAALGGGVSFVANQRF